MADRARELVAKDRTPRLGALRLRSRGCCHGAGQLARPTAERHSRRWRSQVWRRFSRSARNLLRRRLAGLRCLGRQLWSLKSRIGLGLRGVLRLDLDERRPAENHITTESEVRLVAAVVTRRPVARSLPRAGATGTLSA
jgi:hypothetical protein